MPRYIAFLRAINVGGHTVKMDYLAELFSALKLADVETFIASGNVAFSSQAKDSTQLEKKIERHLEASLGYPVATFIRTPAELAEIVAYEAFRSSELSKGYHAIYVGFLNERPNAAAIKKLLTNESGADCFRVHNREVYWLRRIKESEAKFSGAHLEKALGLPATLRNLTTVKKLAAKYPATAGRKSASG